MAIESNEPLTLETGPLGTPILVMAGHDPAVPLIRVPALTWDESSSPARGRRDADHWIVDFGIRNLVCQVTPCPPGRFGELRLGVVVRNDSDQPIRPTLLPFGLRGAAMEPSPWLDDDLLLLGHPFGRLGSLGKRRVWMPSEFHGDVFVIAPIRKAGCCLTAALLAGQVPPRPLAPGASASFSLHLAVVRGRRHDALSELFRRRGGYRVDPASYDFTEFRDSRLAWAREITAAWMNWAWDQENLDPLRGTYRLTESLLRYRRLFGGFDAFMLWPFWPRAGFDGRSQLDHYLDMPGGVEGLRRELERARRLAGARSIVAWCHWGETDRDPSPAVREAGFRALVDLACRIRADGVVMDLMAATPEAIRVMARERGWELAPYSEADPSWKDSQTNIVGRIHNTASMPVFNLKRYLLPHLPMLRVCEPGNANKIMHRDLILSFFSGHGVEINSMFPPSHPACRDDWPILARMLDILRTQRDCFASPAWEPLIECLTPKVHANLWPAEGKRLWTLFCEDAAGHQGPLLRLPRSGAHYVDLWRYRPLRAEPDGEEDVIAYRMDGYEAGRFNGEGDGSPGCIAAFQPKIEARLDFEMLRIAPLGPMPAGDGWSVEVWTDTVSPDREPLRYEWRRELAIDLFQALGGHTNEAIVARLVNPRGQVEDVVVIPEAPVRFFRVDKPKRTNVISDRHADDGMVWIPPGRFVYRVCHSQPTWQHDWHHADKPNTVRVSEVFTPGDPSAPRELEMAGFWMDRYPVTNAQFATFLRESGYRPPDPAKFLGHWRDGRIPSGLESHPVVYVDYNDAKAYAEWAGKRLPTEEEWQYAAGGADGRAWPWGNEYDPARCNDGAGSTTPVHAYPAGASPYGVEDLVGNVWQWTASLTDNGRHLMVFLRGGCWYRPPRGPWWVRGGPRRIDDHMPLPLFGPAMNRLATVGFRCVRDGSRYE